MPEHMGFPLGLRVRPNVNTSENRAAFARAFVVTHALAKVKPNGLPESDYNLSLQDFDLDIVNSIEGEKKGLVVIIETYAGQRKYYAFVDANATFKARLADLQAKYPEHVLTVENGMDPEWDMYEDYRRQFPWPRNTI